MRDENVDQVFRWYPRGIDVDGETEKERLIIYVHFVMTRENTRQQIIRIATDTHPG